MRIGVEATAYCSIGFQPRAAVWRMVLSRRDSAIVAWHEVPGNRRPKNRPVGYGLIRTGTRTDSTIGAISLPYKHGAPFRRKTSAILGPHPIIPCPTGRFLMGWDCSRHSVPGYDRTVPGRSTSSRLGAFARVNPGKPRLSSPAHRDGGRCSSDEDVNWGHP
jgi:hypothetical protein